MAECIGLQSYLIWAWVLELRYRAAIAVTINDLSFGRSGRTGP